MVSQSVVDKLNATCLLLAETLVWQSINVDRDFLDRELPGLTYNFAVKLDLWLTPQPRFNLADLGVESCEFGNFIIPIIERDYFVKLLADSLTFLYDECESENVVLEKSA